ncbi:hypothetical protein DCS_06371 [Drechmeria coniospora]|uniref:DUF5722 domain-containing protein n=1 Tax=Drechmeria coniospora TaxID=98403 RepID=A0A151GBI1_DRECN|nr:hypothetical protein DCS_06371 [Drechmeria coniospora]KYK54413.1 hypothetical protein DCS_06371 [Drechmeria coniospora]
MNEIYKADPGSQSLYLIWADWEPRKKAAPCAADEQEYDGHCFIIAPEVDEAIRTWSEQGLITLAFVYGTPAWARSIRPCEAGIYCVPDDAADYGRFGGMLARRYNGLNGNGRIADFVLGREVGNYRSFDIGCGPGSTACDKTEWINLIVANYNAGYDAIFAEQSTARIMTSIDNKFGETLENAADGQLCGKSVLLGLGNNAGGRLWRASINAYNKPEALRFDYLDYPYVTMGNVGILVGWLIQQFPNEPQVRDVQLAEQGLPGRPNFEDTSASSLCFGFRNALGTPGIDNYIYYHMLDQPGEIDKFGLFREDGTPKGLWGIWANSSRPNWSPGLLSHSCGFQNLPYLEMNLGRGNSGSYIASSRKLPSSYLGDGRFFLHHSEQPNSIMLYECSTAAGSRLMADPSCNNELPYGPVGWIYTSQVLPSTVPLYSCYNQVSGAYFPSFASDCRGQPNVQVLGLLGYVFRNLPSP